MPHSVQASSRRYFASFLKKNRNRHIFFLHSFLRYIKSIGKNFLRQRGNQEHAFHKKKGRGKKANGVYRSPCCFVARIMAIIWEFGSQQPDNAENFKVIAEWWKSLKTQKVVWKQRIISQNGQVDWAPQKFDETFAFFDVDVRGISFFWKKDDKGGGGDITPAKLEFTPLFQRVYLYPESRKDVVICVEVPFKMDNMLLLTNPSWFAERLNHEVGAAASYQLVVRDHETQTEIKIQMDQGNLYYLQHALAQLA